jgi:hypothetical protein
MNVLKPAGLMSMTCILEHHCCAATYKSATVFAHRHEPGCFKVKLESCNWNFKALFESRRVALQGFKRVRTRLRFFLPHEDKPAQAEIHTALTGKSGQFKPH